MNSNLPSRIFRCGWRVCLSLSLGVMVLAGPATVDAAFPEKPVTVVAPFPPGGAADTLARIVARHLTLQFPGSNFIVENKAGAGTIVGAQVVARSAADGYTLIVAGGATFTINPAMHKSLPYDPVRDFESIGFFGSIPYVMLAGPSSPGSSVRELVEAARARPGALNYGSFGNGTGAHIATEMFKEAAGIDLVHVPYKGSAPAMQDLMGGQIPVLIDTVIAAMPQIKAGRVKPLAVTTPQRLQDLPDVPTMAELGYPGAGFTAWMTVAAPRGLTGTTRTALVKALADAMATPAMQADLSRVGLDVRYQPPSVYDALVAEEIPAYRKLFEKVGIRAN